MPRNPRIETNAPQERELIAYVRRRAGSLRRGKKHEVRHGFVVEYSLRRGRRKGRLFDLPHWLTMVGLVEYPRTTTAAIYVPTVKISPDRGGLTSKGVELQYSSFQEILDADIDLATRIVSRGNLLNASGLFSRQVTTLDASDPTRLVAGFMVSTDSVIDADNNTTAGVIVLLRGHFRPEIQIAVNESVLESVLGVRLLVRGMSRNDITGLPLPCVRSDYVGNRVVTSIPALTQHPGGTADHGRKVLVLILSDLTEVGEETLSVFGAQLPSQPQYEQPLRPPRFTGDPDTGYTPSLLEMKPAVHPLGGAIVYGSFAVQLYPEGDYTEDSWAVSLFYVRVNAAGQAALYTVRTTFTASSLAYLGYDAPPGYRLNYTLYGRTAAVSLFTGADPQLESSYVSWGTVIALRHDEPSGGFEDGDAAPYTTSGPGAQEVYSASQFNKFILVVMRNDVVVFDDLPEPYKITTYSSPVNLAARYVGTASINHQLVACHLSEGGEFGVSFFVFDDANNLLLAKWDSIDGFGIWDVDLSAAGGPADFEVGRVGMYINCYRQQTLDEDGKPTGDPGFCVSIPNQTDNIGAGYILTNGKLFKYTDYYAPAAKPIGNTLTVNESTRGAYQSYTESED